MTEKTASHPVIPAVPEARPWVEAARSGPFERVVVPAAAPEPPPVMTLTCIRAAPEEEPEEEPEDEEEVEELEQVGQEHSQELLELVDVQPLDEPLDDAWADPPTEPTSACLFKPEARRTWLRREQ